MAGGAGKEREQASRCGGRGESAASSGRGLDREREEEPVSVGVEQEEVGGGGDDEGEEGEVRGEEEVGVEERGRIDEVVEAAAGGAGADWGNFS